MKDRPGTRVVPEAGAPLASALDEERQGALCLVGSSDVLRSVAPGRKRPQDTNQPPRDADDHPSPALSGTTGLPDRERPLRGGAVCAAGADGADLEHVVAWLEVPVVRRRTAFPEADAVMPSCEPALEALGLAGRPEAHERAALVGRDGRPRDLRIRGGVRDEDVKLAHTQSVEARADDQRGPPVDGGGREQEW